VNVLPLLRRSKSQTLRFSFPPRSAPDRPRGQQNRRVVYQRTKAAGSGGAGNLAIGFSVRRILDRASLTPRAIEVAILNGI
jgi:hypothetical protein